ncbi:hypothetical protein Tco_1079497 [Tanacetum coccineum]|uniref:Uncharacterized protein n=1 Tax=Tanacetum coccineum TaxID=301880 RepID=A0ABQ5HTM3_9ASTR
MALVCIEATIDGHAHTITEASIRSSLRLNDQGATVCLPTDDIYSGLAAIGYVPDQGVWRLCFFKNKFSPQWKFLIHTLIMHRFQGDRIISRLSLIFQSMVSNITGTKKFLMYPSLIQMILNGTVMPLLPSMLHIVDENPPSVVVTSLVPTVDPGTECQTAPVDTHKSSPSMTTTSKPLSEEEIEAALTLSAAREKQRSFTRLHQASSISAERLYSSEKFSPFLLHQSHPPTYHYNPPIYLSTAYQAERQEAFEMEARQSQVAEQIYYDSLLAQRLVEEEERSTAATLLDWSLRIKVVDDAHLLDDITR